MVGQSNFTPLFRTAIHSVLACGLAFAHVPAHPADFFTSVPEGFEDLAVEQSQVVDLTFEGRMIGVFEVEINGEMVTFKDPGKVYESLPQDLKSPEILLALKGPLDRNQDRVCPRNASSLDCGYVEAELLAVIHDTARYSLQLFVNPLFRKPYEMPAYLPKPQGTWSAASQLTFLATGQDGDGASGVFASADTLISHGAARFASFVTRSDESGIVIEEAAAEYDLDGMRAYGGLFYSTPDASFSRGKLLGVGIRSQIDTRFDKHRIIGNPVVIYLQSRGRVEVRLENRILYSGILNAGGNTIDTTSFPQGSYELDIRISETGLVERREKQFFSKNRSIPPANIPFYFAELGLERSLARGSPSDSDEMLARAGAGLRLSENWAVGAAGEVRDSTARGELQLTYVGDLVLGEANLGFSDDGDAFGALRVVSSGRGPLNFNFDLRQIITGAQGEEHALLGVPKDRTQATGAISYRAGEIRLSLLGSLGIRDDYTRHSLAANATWNVLRRGNTIISATGEASTSNAGVGFFLGASLRLVGKRGGVGAAVRYQKAESNTAADGFFGSMSVDGRWDIANDTAISALAAFEESPSQFNLSGSAELMGDHLALNADILDSTGEGFSETTYSIGGSTTLLLSPDTASFVRRSADLATIIVEIEGSRDDDSFEVMIDEQPRILIEGDTRKLFAVPAYEAYRVRLRPKGPGRVLIEEPEREISLYPGNSSVLRFRIEHLTSIVGRLTSQEGEALGQATIIWERESAITDSQGYFQLDAPPQAPIQITSAKGEKYKAQLPDFSQEELYVRVGPVLAIKERE